MVKAALGVVGTALLIIVPGASAADFTVTDGGNSGAGTLRQAMASALTSPGADRIVFDGVSTVTLTSALEVTGAESLTIDGGSDLGQVTIQRSSAGGTPQFGIFVANGPLTLLGLTIRNGRTTTSGAGIRGDITGPLSLTGVVLRDNFTQPATGDAGASALSSSGPVTIDRSWITANTSTGGTGGCGRAAVSSQGASVSDTFTVTRTSITQNTNVSGGGANCDLYPAGLDLGSPFTLRTSTVSANTGGVGFLARMDGTITGSTISHNAGGGITVGTSQVTFRSSILSDATVACRNNGSVITSGGNNVVEGTGCPAVGTDTTGDPALGALDQPNAVFGPVRPIPQSSIAVDRGQKFDQTTDGRGNPRTAGHGNVPNAGGSDGTDAGAYEVIDTIGPTLDIPAIATGTNRRPTLVFGADESLGTANCTLDSVGVPCTTNTNPPSYTPPADLAIGTHTFAVVSATDVFGNPSGAGATRDFTIGAPPVVQPPVVVPPVVQPPVTPPVQPPTTPPVVAKVRPNTSISSGPSRTRSTRPVFRFRSTVKGATFQCKVDKGRWKSCRSGRKLATLKVGKHTLQVRAVANGLTDTTPAKKTFRVLRPRRA